MPAPDLDYYQNTAKVRPGAFMGWQVDSYSKHPADPIAVDPITGQACHYTVYEAMCNWHSQFLFYWIVAGEPLLQALGDANDLAMSWLSDPPVDHTLVSTIFRGNAPDERVEFNPATCLRAFGYGDLRFNWYNHSGDWP
jgi:hypothetical protein